MITTCDTLGAFVKHLRAIPEGQEPKYEGCPSYSRTLCGLKAAWDCRTPVEQATCVICQSRFQELGL